MGQLKAENERFREEVNAHFVQSAQLINELTDSYKKVFDHLSDGADRLVDKDTTRDRMPQVGRQEVRLRHIGAPKDFGPATPAKSAGSSQPEPKPEPKPTPKPTPKTERKPSDDAAREKTDDKADDTPRKDDTA